MNVFLFLYGIELYSNFPEHGAEEKRKPKIIADNQSRWARSIGSNYAPGYSGSSRYTHSGNRS